MVYIIFAISAGIMCILNDTVLYLWTVNKDIFYVTFFYICENKKCRKKKFLLDNNPTSTNREPYICQHLQNK